MTTLTKIADLGIVTFDYGGIVLKVNILGQVQVNLPTKKTKLQQITL